LTKDTKYLILLALLYFAVSLVGILHHELWLDEAHHWLLARDSDSVSELIENTKIEGHPLLWSFILYGISRFTTDPFWMQFVHILISSSAVFLFLKKAPFDWLFKLLFIFGYFMLFEYNLISRNYGLGILFLFLACTFFQNREQKFSLLCLWLALATNSHLLFSVPAFALFLTLLMEQTQNRQLFKKQYWGGYLIFGLGLLLVYIQIHATNSGWLLDPINKLPFQERIVGGVAAFFKGLITIPDFRTMHFWNSNLIVNLSRPIAGILALGIYLLPLLLFFKNRKTLFFVYTALIGAQIFFFVTQRTATRFHGVTYIIIIMALWIEHYYVSEDYKYKAFLNPQKLALLRKPIIYSILIIQFCSGIYAYAMDYVYPFSSAKTTVDYLKGENLNNKQVVSVTCEGTLISAYLEKKVYFLCDGGYRGFCHWDANYFTNINEETIIQMIHEHVDVEKNFIYVSCYPLKKQDLKSNVKLLFLKKFDRNIVDKTNYFVYGVSKI
jgi:hypothetical protein